MSTLNFYLLEQQQMKSKRSYINNYNPISEFNKIFIKKEQLIINMEWNLTHTFITDLAGTINVSTYVFEADLEKMLIKIKKQNLKFKH